MAISQGMMKLLLRESARSPFSGSVLQLGRQACTFSMQEVQAWAPHYGATLVEANGVLSKKPTLPQSLIDDRRFLLSLGFREVMSCDVTDHEGADIILDLNKQVPRELCERFDVVMNIGTSEHVFHVPQVLANLHQMVAPAGRIIHWVPASNQVDHGLYSFSPTLFYDYYQANHYAIEGAYLVEGLEWGGVLSAYIYNPGPMNHCVDCFEPFSKVALFFIVRKTAESTSHTIPMQGSYVTEWSTQSGPPVNESIAASSNWRQLLKTQFPVAVMKSRIVLNRVRQIQRRLSRPRKLPFLGYF
jgi:hypothetical protein